MASVDDNKHEDQKFAHQVTMDDVTARWTRQVRWQLCKQILQSTARVVFVLALVVFILYWTLVRPK